MEEKGKKEKHHQQQPSVEDDYSTATEGEETELNDEIRESNKDKNGELLEETAKEEEREDHKEESCKHEKYMLKFGCDETRREMQDNTKPDEDTEAKNLGGLARLPAAPPISLEKKESKADLHTNSKEEGERNSGTTAIQFSTISSALSSGNERIRVSADLMGTP